MFQIPGGNLEKVCNTVEVHNNIRDNDKRLSKGCSYVNNHYMIGFLTTTIIIKIRLFRSVLIISLEYKRFYYRPNIIYNKSWFEGIINTDDHDLRSQLTQNISTGHTCFSSRYWKVWPTLATLHDRLWSFLSTQKEGGRQQRLPR